MMTKKLIPYITIYNGRPAAAPSVLNETGMAEASEGLAASEPESADTPCDERDIAAFGSRLSDNGADALIVFDRSDDDASHDADIAVLASLCRAADMPVMAAGHMNRLEDVKKALYAGCKGVILNGSRPHTAGLLKEASDRFGKDKVAVSFASEEDLRALSGEAGQYASGVVLMTPFGNEARNLTALPIIELGGFSSVDEMEARLRDESVSAISGGILNDGTRDLHMLKAELMGRGLDMAVPESRIRWEDFRLNSDGLIPVISQDAVTDEVLILAYMNEEAFNKTIRTGKMTYFSRSRQSLWTKGETSGHFQYVRSLMLDCDNDTILARVIQIGPACHTGRKSCFFQPLYEKTGPEKNARHVLDDVYGIIRDRKVHPKEGSYTNYLFDKGIDKILKKVGEENTEIIIAAKNPDASEIRYEISDYLYHLMVLMVEKGVTWEEIADELARR